jgi:taurine dioxygenase
MNPDTDRAKLNSTDAARLRSIAVTPMRAALGALVECGDVKSLADSEFEQVRHAFLDHLVLLIRGQTLSDPDLLAFGRRFGELTSAAPVHIGQQPRQYPELAVISNVVENGVAIGGLGDGEAVWHSDSCFNEIPPGPSILHSLELPPAGGDTGFTNMYLALETLPADLRAAIKGKAIKHDLRYTSGGQLRPGYTGKEDIRSTPGPSHAIVRRHPETGCNALYLGRRPHAYVSGLPLAESEALLDALWAHAGQPQASWHHQWKVGDILIWDNRCAMHRRDAFDPHSRRIMHRTQCKGVPVIEGDDAAPPHPRAHLRQSSDFERQINADKHR